MPSEQYPDSIFCVKYVRENNSLVIVFKFMCLLLLLLLRFLFLFFCLFAYLFMFLVVISLSFFCFLWHMSLNTHVIEAIRFNGLSMT